MTRILDDPNLTPPDPPETLPRLGEHPPSLALAGPCGNRAFLVEGASAVAVGEERGGLRWVRLAGGIAVADMRVHGGTYVNAVASPGLMRRERVVDGASQVETVLAAPVLPLLAVQWTSGPTSPGADEFHLSMRLLPGARALRYRTSPDGDCLVACDVARPDEGVSMCVVPGPEILGVEADPGGGLRVGVTTSAAEAPTLLLAAGPLARMQAVLDGAAHLHAHERRASEPAAEGLALRTGVAELDEGAAWATMRMRAALARLDAGTSRADLLWTAVGALAVGEEDTVSALALSDEPQDAVAVLLAARVALTLGDARPARRALERLRERGDGRPGATGSAEDALLWAPALESLADALRHAASPDAVEALRADARAASRRSGGVRLPMVGERSDEAHPRHALGALLRPGEASPPDPGEASAELEAWSALARGDTEDGWTRWRAELARGIGGGPGGRGTWDATGPGAPRTGILLGALVHGLLGWSPDAPSGRARLAPHLPPHLLRFGVRGLRAGDARVAFRYARHGADEHTFELEPLAGRTPLNVVLTPRVPIASVTEVRLDDAPVALELAPLTGGTVVPLQLSLDRTRSLTVRGPERAET